MLCYSALGCFGRGVIDTLKGALGKAGKVSS